MSQIAELIRIHAKTFSLDPLLVASVILHESKGNPSAVRFEEAWFEANLRTKARNQLAGYVPPEGEQPSLYDEKIWRAHSWGWTQILGDTARVLGYRAQFLPELLRDDSANIYLGCKKLGACFLSVPAKSENVTMKALLKYNGGKNLAYPGLVLEIFHSVEPAKFLNQ